MNSDRRIALEHVACALCGSDGERTLLVGRDNEHDLVGSFAVVECLRCGHVYTNPRPTSDSLASLYPPDYGSFSATSDRRFAGLWARYVHFVQFGERLRQGRGRRLLEIGCGTGANLAAHAASGWIVRGIEPSSSAVARARAARLDVVEGTEVDIDALAPGGFEEIHALMVLEHVPDPIATLERLHRVATDGARLVVSVPCFDSRSRRRFNADWYALQLPRHFHHFTEETLSVALSRAGWQVRRVWYQPTTADWRKSFLIRYRSTAWAPVVRGILRIGGAVDVILCPALAKAAERWGSSRMTVFAERSAATTAV